MPNVTVTRHHGIPQSTALGVTEAIGGDGAVAPRIAKDTIEEHIDRVNYLVIDKTGTFCIITCKNGFQVTGFSKPMSDQNFDPDKGRTFSYEQAFRQLWPLFAFAAMELAYIARRADDTFGNEQTGERAGSIAARYMNHEDPNVRTLAGSVLTQRPDHG
jgi:hypothetical protein